MAGITREKTGAWRLSFYDADGERRFLRLPKMPKAHAERFRLRLEALVAARTIGAAIDTETARWVAELPQTTHEKLVQAELIEPRERHEATLGQLVDRFTADVRVKASTLTTYEQATNDLLNFFGEDRGVRTFTTDDAEAWLRDARARLASATVNRRIKHAKQLFNRAVAWKLATENPFRVLKAGSMANAERSVFVPREHYARVIEQCPDAAWRLLVALSRIGGLRVPSEARALRWSDVDWEGGRLTVRASKTSGSESGGVRALPMFPELRAHLLEAFEQAEPGENRVLPWLERYTNPHTQLKRMIERAGLTPWPRLWHNMRASRQTELASQYPLHTVCAWLGNSRIVAHGHYLQVTDADWSRAIAAPEGQPAKRPGGGTKSGSTVAPNPAPHPNARARTDSPESPESTGFEEVLQAGAGLCTNPHRYQVTPTGFEPVSPP